MEHAKLARTRIAPRLDLIAVACRLHGLGFRRDAILRALDPVIAATEAEEAERAMRTLRGQRRRVRRTAARRRAEIAHMIATGPTAA